MGRTIIDAVEREPDLELAGRAGSRDDLQGMISRTSPDVVVDVTVPEAAYKNALTIVSCKCNGVMGTTGISPAERDELGALAAKNGTGLLIAPNFCIGAVLMMKMAAEAARYLPNVEIVEYHHDHKADAPSGTAIATAEFINRMVTGIRSPAVESRELLDGHSRGARNGAIPIHAVRLPGFVASQEVIFGGEGHTLRIRHDTTDRRAYMPGVLHSVRNLPGKTGLYYGLESLLFPT